MGSGELTATMVETHKMLLKRLGPTAKATFLDTPAGFQLNADQISANAGEFFRKNVGHALEVTSYKSQETVSDLDAALACQQLRESDYVLLGPGSPTYTVKQLRHSAIPSILVDCIQRGGCLTAASAAALTMGRSTLPVYEIYKAGEPLHWVPGLDILGHFGLNLVVIPHWNNAEGGTHDTSRCFMGEGRFVSLVDLLEEPVPILGLDEHTACIIDLSDDSFHVRGIGRVIYQDGSMSQVFTGGTRYSLGHLRGEESATAARVSVKRSEQEPGENRDDRSFWQQVHALDNQIRVGVASGDGRQTTTGLLDLDRLLWNTQSEMHNPEMIAQARDLFRELLVLIGTRPRLTAADQEKLITPLVEQLVSMRQRFRDEENWPAADGVRDALSQAGIEIKDTAGGYAWHVKSLEEER